MKEEIEVESKPAEPKQPKTQQEPGVETLEQEPVPQQPVAESMHPVPDTKKPVLEEVPEKKIPKQ